MSKVAVACPNCSATLTVPADILGRKIKCPKCQEVVRLPTVSDPGPRAANSSLAGPQAREKPLAPSAPSAVPTSAVPTSAPAGSHAPAGSPSGTQPARAKKIVVAKPPEPVNDPDGVPAEKPPVPMAKVLSPERQPVAANPPIPVPLRDLKSDGPSFDELGATLAAVESKPRLKIPRKRSNPWPVILLGTTAVAMLGLIVMLLIVFLPRDPSGGPKIPEIQYVADSRTEVGQTVRIPISVTYPTGYSQTDKLSWQLRAGEQNPPGADWDAASGHLVWAPGTRDAGKSRSLSMVIQDTQTRESNLATFQVHVPPLAPSIMAAVDYWERQGVEFQVGLPRPDTVLLGTEGPATLMEFEIAEHRVLVYAYPDLESAALAFSMLDQSTFEPSEEMNLSPPLVFATRDGAIILAEESAIEANAAIKAWLEPTP
jgi:hypothetical protein